MMVFAAKPRSGRGQHDLLLYSSAVFLKVWSNLDAATRHMKGQLEAYRPLCYRPLCYRYFRLASIS